MGVIRIEKNLNDYFFLNFVLSLIMNVKNYVLYYFLVEIFANGTKCNNDIYTLCTLNKSTEFFRIKNLNAATDSYVKNLLNELLNLQKYNYIHRIVFFIQL